MPRTRLRCGEFPRAQFRVRRGFINICRLDLQPGWQDGASERVYHRMAEISPKRRLTILGDAYYEGGFVRGIGDRVGSSNHRRQELRKHDIAPR